MKEQTCNQTCNQFATEYISKQSAINAISCDIIVTGRRNAELVAETIGTFVDRIKALPPAEPNWIPCSVRMPEEHEWLGTKHFGTTKSDEVYVTFESPKGERFCSHLSFQNGKLSAFDQSTIDAFFKGSRPIAWRPLPEAWKGEANDTKVR